MNGYFFKPELDQVIEIRNQYKNGGITRKTLASMFSVCRGTIDNIVTYKKMV